jgi:hypothetical protein
MPDGKILKGQFEYDLRVDEWRLYLAGEKS